jgi:hypothetical protein
MNPAFLPGKGVFKVVVAKMRPAHTRGIKRSGVGTVFGLFMHRYEKTNLDYARSGLRRGGPRRHPHPNRRI